MDISIIVTGHSLHGLRKELKGVYKRCWYSLRFGQPFNILKHQQHAQFSSATMNVGCQNFPLTYDKFIFYTLLLLTILISYWLH